MTNPTVFFDIAIDNEKIGRVVCELFPELAPKACENFLHICKGDTSLPDGTTLTYKHNRFHRVIKNFMVQAGDLTYGSVKGPLDSKIGVGGASIWSEKLIEANVPATGLFDDENTVNLDTTFNLCMANAGKDTNFSQFFINTYPSPHLNGKHTVFGKVIKGKSTIRTIEYEQIDEDGTPRREIVIEDCGEWDESMGVPVYNASYNEICGDVYEEFPDDDDHFDKDKSAEAFDATNKIKDSGSALFKQKNYLEAYLKYKKALRYANELIPDQDSEPEIAPKFEELKKKIYNNLALVCINLKDYQKAIQFSTYLLESYRVSPADQAKGFYRRAVSKFELAKYNDAMVDFKNCLKLNPDDEEVKKKIEDTELKLKAIKDKEKAKYAKFFG